MLVNNLSKIIVCAHCGKSFIKNTQSAYKLINNGKTVYYCSYKCWSSNDTRRYNYHNGRYTKANEIRNHSKW